MRAAGGWSASARRRCRSPAVDSRGRPAADRSGLRRRAGRPDRGEPPSERLLRGLVHLAAGNRDSLQAYCREALTDWRDVVRAAEYDGHDARIRDFNLPFAERAAQGEGDYLIAFALP